MPLRSATITQLRYAKKNARAADKWKNVADLPDGSDFLHFAHGVWNGLSKHTLRDREKQRYCEPEDKIVRGRALALSAHSGTYGDPGSVRDVETGVERLSHSGELTNASKLRVGIFVPSRGTSALMFIEHSTGLVFGSRFLDQLKLCWDQEFPEWTLKAETLTRPDAWLKNAELEAVTAEVYKHRANIEDKGQPVTMGVLRSVLEPLKGSKYFPHRVLEGLQDKSLTGAALMGLPEEPDQLKLTLGDGDQRKTFVLGKDRTPSIRMVVTDYGQPALDLEGWRRWCAGEAKSLFSTVGVQWDSSMLNGDWTAENLAKKVVFNGR